LIIFDAYRILMTNGPGGPGEVKDAGEVVVGTDPVAVDVYGSVLLEKDPGVIRYIRMAADLGIGQKEMDRINTVYVDAQKAVAEAEEAEEGQEEAQEETPEPEPVGEEPVSEETPEPEVSEEEPVVIGEEEKEAGIPAVILVMAGIVSFLIGLRMRRMKKKEEVE